jgi:hypothetical protein
MEAFLSWMGGSIRKFYRWLVRSAESLSCFTISLERIPMAAHAGTTARTTREPKKKRFLFRCSNAERRFVVGRKPEERMGGAEISLSEPKSNINLSLPMVSRFYQSFSSDEGRSEAFYDHKFI